MKITIEGSDFSEVPDGVYDLDPYTLEDFYMDTDVLVIRGPVMDPKPKPDVRGQVLREALELLWRTQVEAETYQIDKNVGTPPGSYWIEDLEERSGIRDVNRHGWTE